VKFNEHTQSYSNGLLKWNMDYNLGSTLIFKYIFCYDFISIFFIGMSNIWYVMEKQIWIEKNYNKKFNQQITMDFWMTKFGPHFQKSQSYVFDYTRILNLKWYFPSLYGVMIQESNG
jgi:hypothetical protein